MSLALGVTALLYYLQFFEIPQKQNDIHVKYQGDSVFFHANFDTTVVGISQFNQDINNPSCIILLGSSELTTNSEFIPYQFFNSKGICDLKAYGHAFYQSFSMYCNLLAFRNKLANKKICIILSPGWFETEGTNTQSFLEFVRPEMLANIVHSNFATENEKKLIGEFIVKNDNNFAGLSPQMEYFSTLYKSYVPFKQTILEQLKEKINVYQFEICEPKPFDKSIEEPNWDSIAIACHQNFSEQCSNNFLIKDDLLKVILDGRTSLKKKEFNPIDIRKNQEYKDFKALVQLLKDCNAKPIFVMQGLLPFGYDHLERFDEFSTAIEQDLKAFGFPFLNLFEPHLEKYKPGTLNDFMHMGDLGWNSVNQFIYQNFCHEQAN